DIQSARKKIQRNTIGHAGCESVDLWRASLSAIIVSRKVFLLAPVFKMFNATNSIVKAGEQNDESTQNGHAFQVDNDLRVDMPVADGLLEQSLSTLSLGPDSVNFEDNQTKRTYASTLMTTSPVDSLSPELATSDDDAVLTMQSSTKILRTSASSRDRFEGSEKNVPDGDN
ncbi:hypothetical protein KCU77_g16679, partial [Aureobasidium melanogenum]